MTKPLAETSPLPVDHLWHAQMTDSEYAVITDGELEGQRLLRWGQNELVRKSSYSRTFDEAARPLRPIFNAAARNLGSLPADDQLTPHLRNAQRFSGELRAEGEEELSIALGSIAEQIIQQRRMRYPKEIKAINRSLADLEKQGRVFYLGYGSEAFSQFHVGRLARLALTPRDQFGMQRPVALVVGKDGKLGTKPAGRNTRSQLYEAK